MMSCAGPIAADFGKGGGKFKTFNAKVRRRKGTKKKQRKTNEKHYAGTVKNGRPPFCRRENVERLQTRRTKQADRIVSSDLRKVDKQR